MVNNSNFLIIIPSYHRYNQLRYDKGHTLKYMNKEVLSKTILFVRSEELSKYEEVHRYYGVDLYGHHNLTNIVQTRDAIFETFNTIEKLIVIDDDLQFAYREKIGGPLLDQTKNEFQNMIRNLTVWCDDEYPLVGITSRAFSNGKTTFRDENTRIIQVYCYHMPTINKIGIRYSQAGFPYMTDYWFTLKMLTLGYKNCCLNKWTRNDKMQTPGGCSEDRTTEKLNKSALKLARQFPNFVIPKMKAGSYGDHHVSVSVQWKKAFNQEACDRRQECK